ncbi:MAG: hypothetical protein ACRCYY_09655 [Trueperaceae bacterium]
MRYFRNLFLLLITGLLLTSCNFNQLLPRAELVVSLIDSSSTAPNFNETQIEVGTATGADGTSPSFTIQSVRFMASAKAGSMGATITDYEILYYYADGSPAPTASGQSFRGSLSLRVPAGIKCPEVAPDDETGSSSGQCSVNTEGVDFAAGERVVSGSFLPIDIDVINTLYTGQAARNEAFANITLSGQDDNGNPFATELGPVSIIFVADAE